MFVIGAGFDFKLVLQGIDETRVYANKMTKQAFCLLRKGLLIFQSFLGVFG